MVSHNMTRLLLILELALIVCHKLTVYRVIQLTFIVCQKVPSLLHLLLALSCKVNLHGMSLSGSALRFRARLDGMS